MTAPVRVLIVDDSPTIRQLLGMLLSRDPEIEVIGEAPEPAVARQMIKALNPDVITLDVEMPNMNGLEFLEKIMRLRPMPVVMVSTLTKKGADITLAALELGAVDYFPKPTENAAAILEATGQELVAKVKVAAKARVRPLFRPVLAEPCQDFDPGDSVVAIGSSTGGVEALLQVLSAFPANCPPTVITQHMPAHFTTSFAARLSRLCRPKVDEARDGDLLCTGQVFLAPGGDAHLEVAGRGNLRCRLTASPLVSGHRPSVDVLFHSLASSAGARAVGVILTGMGSDGATGLMAMRKADAATIGQDEASSIIYGMPRAAFERGAVAVQLPLEKIGPEILRICRTSSEGRLSHARSS
jgi:two-component system, chemotaxis family, protein-glutamate methylesterase/glutaminase